jgi:4-hydroxy-3-polyprenylbenzoate decarboxylase
VNDPLIHIKKIYHRNNPILTIAQPGRSDDFNFQRVIARSALVWDELEKAGVPDVKGVWCHEAGASRFLIVVSINQRYAGHARQAASIACQCHAGAFTGRYVIVVDEDIDPSNTFDVLWAFSTRSDPATDIDILRRTWSSSADPLIHPDIPARQKGLNSRALVDACRPYEWRDRFPPTVQTSPELEKVVYEKFPQVKGIVGD